MALCGHLGYRVWSSVAKLVPGRSDVQCRERWANVLDPQVRTVERFSPEEDKALRSLVEQHTRPGRAPKWSAVAAGMPGRTDKQCAVRWGRLR
jgi:hypothetical protein